MSGQGPKAEEPELSIGFPNLPQKRHAIPAGSENTKRVYTEAAIV
jgi:hypothetical protein